MRDLVVDVGNFVSDVNRLKIALQDHDIDVLRVRSNAVDAQSRISSAIFSGAYRRFAVLLNVGDPLKKAFPNNSIEVNGQLDYENRFQKISNMVKWILNGNRKDGMMDFNTFFTSDTHFQHGNIIKYCDRPWKSGAKDANGDLIVTEKDIAEMDEAIVANWNSVIRPDDVVWHLGDFALGNRNNIPDFVRRLNGRKHLVLGNHDYFHVDKNKFRDIVDFFYQAGFEKVYDHPVLLNDFVILSHEPLNFVKAPFFNVYGHVHDNEIFSTYSKHGCCVCVERHNYKPIRWEKICEECGKLGAGKDE